MPLILGKIQGKEIVFDRIVRDVVCVKNLLKLYFTIKVGIVY